MKLPIVLLALSALPLVAAEPNQLTPAEKKDGFKLIFDGKTTDGWRNYKKETISDKWQVVDGALTLTAGGGGDLVTKDEYANFELRFEFKISPDGNSGIMWRVSETKGAPYETGPEYQILDSHGKGYPHELKKLNVAGNFYDIIPGKIEWAKPTDQWNEGSIRLDGSKVTLKINGITSAEIDMKSNEWKELLAKTKFATWDAFAKEPKGHLCIQDHGNVVALRTVRIKELK